MAFYLLHNYMDFINVMNDPKFAYFDYDILHTKYSMII